MHRYQEVVQVATVLLERSGVTEGTLIVRDWPLRGAHNSEVVIKIRVQRAEKSVLR
jgi:hypothetical protein